MTGHVDNEKLLIHCFQDSLKGSAAKWYNKLSRSQIRSWRDLAKAFTEQYKHIIDMDPDRLTLQNMEKRSNESFRQYAQRWRDVAMQVQPPLLERELTPTFVGTLKAPFLQYLVGNATKSFEDLVISGKANRQPSPVSLGGVDIPTIASTLKTAAARMSPQLMENNRVMYPSVEWSGHIDNCVYPEDSSGTYVTTVDVQPSHVSLGGVEWTH
ncbi:hypothetical protein GQ457_03G008950 [Hibiscus cannabinus]